MIRRYSFSTGLDTPGPGTEIEIEKFDGGHWQHTTIIGLDYLHLHLHPGSLAISVSCPYGLRVKA